AIVKVKNDALLPGSFSITQSIEDAGGYTIATNKLDNLQLNALHEKEFNVTIPVTKPKLWDLESPYLYKLVTTITQDGKIADQYETSFGIRTIRFDANEGFFLNGKHVKIKGTNNHQDHAGVGSALPDALQYFRISTLKAMGSNAYRCSHHPPTPELLDACDRLGMLVIDENRLMGINAVHLDDLKKLLERDRNHPSIISWSIGNEEWGIENSITGARIAKTMETFVKNLDTTRAVTAAVSGGFKSGISDVIEVMGYNYLGNGDIDDHHKHFLNQPGMGTEEGSTFATRGIYFTDNEKHYAAAYDKKPRPSFYSIEEGWKFYAARPYFAGMFIWTGFDYRGEPTPYGWPSVTSYFGMMDLCGFPKDNVFYLRSWWSDKPVLHLLPHWNWAGREGQPIAVWAYSNCDEVELFLNKKSLGKKTMEKNGHLEWQVSYAPGTLEAVGYKNGQKILTDVVKTTAAATQLGITQNAIKTGKTDAAVLTVFASDIKGLKVPVAGNDVNFNITGPARIIGVGNGDPTSLENERFIESIAIKKVELLKELPVEDLTAGAETAVNFDDSSWGRAFKDDRTQEFGKKTKALIYRGTVDLPVVEKNAKITFFYKSIGKLQSIYVNGKELGKDLVQSKKGYEFILDAGDVKMGKNTVAVIATPLLKNQSWDVINTDAGAFQILTPAAQWKRKLFNGLAQVIVQPTGQPGEVTLTAASAGLKSSSIKVNFNSN
ncbi:MAG: glycoside hydrolase family 2 TIM barrel-domain containing protein, partial [Mucilaginibacter sp.]